MLASSTAAFRCSDVTQGSVMSLSATRRPKEPPVRDRKTLAKPPSPIFATISYAPILVPGAILGSAGETSGSIADSLGTTTPRGLGKPLLHFGCHARASIVLSKQ